MSECVATMCGLPWFGSAAEDKLLRELGYSCVFAVGPLKGRPLMIGASNDARRRLVELTHLHWQELKVHEIAWMPGPPLAKRLERELHDLLKRGGRHLHGEWFDVTPELVLPAFQIAADKSGVKTWTHTALLDHVRSLRERRIQKVVREANVA